MNNKMQPRHFRLGACAGLAIAAMVFAGCADGKPEASHVSAETDRDATIAVGVRFLQNSWDPSKMPGATIVPIYQLVYENLIGLDADLNLVPVLAEKWTTSDEGITWDIALRENVKFSDGTSFDAEDVKFTLAHNADVGSNVRSDLGGVRSVETIDDHHVRITLASADAGFPEMLAGRAGIILSSEIVTSGDFSVPVGTGMFVLDKEVPGTEVNLVRNPGYRSADAVKLAGVNVLQVNDPTGMVNALRSSEIDIGIIDPEGSDAVKEAGLRTYELQSAQLVAISMNPALSPELADPRVRMALSMAIDRKGIVDGIMFGHASTANQFIASDRFGFNADLADAPYDIEGAKKLLAGAGYPHGFVFEMSAPANNKQLAMAVQASWAEIGVTAELVFPLPGAETWENSSIPLGIRNFVPDLDPASFLRRHLSPEAIGNPGKVEVPGVMRLIEQAQATVDNGGREKFMMDVAERTSEMVPAHIPVIWRNYTIAYSENLVGVQAWQAGYPILDGVGVPAP
ncbi:ABC transporter substrate-binding protein [Microbacterium sp. A93]|uniref:ABC transporter substrate-binding protein n=1 Tax=Microbacterium sp. A93 TaxID=3450716 RepID=UPI003F42BD6A